MKNAFLFLLLFTIGTTYAQTSCHPIKAYLFDNDTQKEIEYKDVKLFVKSIPNDSSFTVDGRVCCLPSGKYTISAEARCYMRYSAAKELEIYNPNDTIELIFEMQQIMHCGMVRFPDVFFETKQCVLNDTSKKIIDTLITILQDNPTLVFELTGSTDSRGSAKNNMKLSQCYVNTVKKYMVSKGVNPKRIVVEAYGETNLVNRCADGVACTEEEHAQNRRVEFKIIRFDFKE